MIESSNTEKKERMVSSKEKEIDIAISQNVLRPKKLSGLCRAGDD